MKGKYKILQEQFAGYSLIKQNALTYHGVGTFNSFESQVGTEEIHSASSAPHLVCSQFVLLQPLDFEMLKAVRLPVSDVRKLMMNM